MDWLQSVNKAIAYVEDNLCEPLGVDDVAGQVYASGAHFGRIFNIVTGVTLGEYIRNRRLSMAGRDLLRTGVKVIDVAMKYQYDTSESFSKAFSRFHGVAPSEAGRHRGRLKYFHPLSISITIQGGYAMTCGFIDDFLWRDAAQSSAQGDKERYKQLVDWARQARGQNPTVFDALTEWLLDDGEWAEGRLPENEQIFMHGVLARFRQQNAQLRDSLRHMAPDVVNSAVFDALDRFDRELAGDTCIDHVRQAVRDMFGDFSVMRDRGVRALIAGSKTGPTGTDTAPVFGYVNGLKECDAGVQWALFMPDLVRRQMSGFAMDRFECINMQAMRFIGWEEADGFKQPGKARALFQRLDALRACRAGIDHDVLLCHHYGKGVDVERPHLFWGRFMQAGTPVPDGFISFDFTPERTGQAGPPFMSQFTYAAFSGDIAAMHNDEGTDGGRLYDITRNIMLARGIGIPYPDKYWTCEVFPNGLDTDSTAFMFSAELHED